MPDAISYSGRFQIWSYSLSHGQLLLRSTKCEKRPTQVDILFKNVGSICLPTTFDDIRIVSGAAQEGLIKFEITTSAGAGWIVAGALAFDESELEYDDASPLLRTETPMENTKRAIAAGAFMAMIPFFAMAAAPSCETPQCLKYRALLGDADAAIELANAAIKTNHAEMVRWYKVAAENGSPVGQYNYATFLVSDSRSVDDCVRALFWFKSALAAGNAHAKDYIGPLQLGISQRKYGKGCAGAID